ncbi:MAG: PAS domain S-box protein, partial [Planctomycetota bacterium]
VQILDAATQVLICATDAQGMITLFNSGAERMLGYTAAEMVGKQTPAILHFEPEVRRRAHELSHELGRQVAGFEVFVAYAREGRFERREWTYVRKDGRHLKVNLVVTAIRNSAGEISGFLGVAEDISDRKQSEEALRRSEERFDLAVAGSHDGLWDWDIRTNDVYYAPRFKELLGYGIDEFANTFTAFETHLHPDDRQPTLTMIRRHLEQSEPYDVEFRLRAKNGAYRWFRARGQAVWDRTGKAVRMAGSLTDLTKQKSAEAALQRSSAELQLANDTLRIAEAEARKGVEQRDHFLAMLSHELRNPLSAISHAVRVLEHAEADRAAVDGAHQAMRRQVQHMSRLLEDLLDLARITHGKIEFRKQTLDLNDLLAEAETAIRPAIEVRRQRLDVVPASQPVVVEGDPARLLQIVDNLLTNASKYTPTGGAVRLELTHLGDRCELSVSDDGRGIDPSLLNDIFNMFYQSDRALDRSDGGMGVGLTLVRTLVEMHEGTVAAFSEGIGKGSRFNVCLPLTAKSLPSEEPPPAVNRGVSVSVVLVEDNPDSREMLQTILTLDGFDVQIANDGRQGLNAILKERPDAALIDIGLPELNGYEVARRVRQELSAAEVFLVALTGYGQAKDRAAALAAGFDEHLVKPYNPDELSSVLRRRGRTKPR